jgi:hypothetical protein
MLGGSDFSIEVQCALVLHVLIEFFLPPPLLLLLIVLFLRCLVSLDYEIYVDDPKELHESSKDQLHTIQIDDRHTQRSSLKNKLCILILISLQDITVPREGVIAASHDSYLMIMMTIAEADARVMTIKASRVNIRK